MSLEGDLRDLTGSLNFISSQDEEETFHQSDLVQLHPFGVSLGTDSNRPFLLLKDSTHEFTLPVALSPIEAGVTLVQSSQSGAPTSPHRFTGLLLESMGVQAVQCVFVQIKGAHQYVRIYLKGHPKQNSIRLRGEEAMSLCLHLEIPIFATRGFIARSKILTAEIEGLGKGLRQIPQLNVKRHSYMM